MSHLFIQLTTFMTLVVGGIRQGRCARSLAARSQDSGPRRVPGVYLTWANPLFLAFFAFNGISNLRDFNVAFSSIPTAPTKHHISTAFRGVFNNKTDLTTIEPT
jgi:hypothetical protein